MAINTSSIESNVNMATPMSPGRPKSAVCSVGSTTKEPAIAAQMWTTQKRIPGSGRGGSGGRYSSVFNAGDSNKAVSQRRTGRHPPDPPPWYTRGSVTKLDYEPKRERRNLSFWLPALLAALCFGGSWLAWSLVGLHTFDPFAYTLVGWVGFFVAVPGSLCGAILFVCSMLVFAAIKFFGPN